MGKYKSIKKVTRYWFYTYIFFFFTNKLSLNVFFSYIISILINSVVVLSFKLNGNETMDAITTLYTEVIFLCYLIVLIVLDILFDIEKQFSSQYTIDEDMLSRNLNIKETSDLKLKLKYNLFNFTPVKFQPTTEAYLDIAFLMFPTSIIFYIVIPTLGFLYNKDLNVESMLSSFSIDVIGHQWYWSYAYNIDFFSNPLLGLGSFKASKLEFDSILDTESSYNRLLTVDNVMVIPSYTNIRLSLTSTDVIHSWAVPQLGIKVDTIPGRITTCNLYTYTVATYYGQCSELCGVAHGFMPIVIDAVPVNLFFDWYYEAMQNEFHEDLIKRLEQFRK